MSRKVKRYLGQKRPFVGNDAMHGRRGKKGKKGEEKKTMGQLYAESSELLGGHVKDLCHE